MGAPFKRLDANGYLVVYVTADVDALISFVSGYVAVLPAKLAAADVSAVLVLLIGVYVAVLVINKLTGLIIFFLKKVFLLAIVSVAFYNFMVELLSRLATEGATQQNVTFGVAGLVIGFLAFVTALYAALYSLRDMHVSWGQTDDQDKVDGQTREVKEKADDEVPFEAPALSDVFSVNTIKNDKSLGAVLTYLVIAEFGVFSSKTIAAPTEAVGVGFFAAFLVAAVLFIRQSYNDFNKGVRHLGVAVLLGGILSILLGHYWGNHPMSTLLGAGYFATDSLVALVTGLSLSLFMGSKS
jgi:ABC-type multidrug transport system fused ATPase/permease subunit